MIDSTLIFEHIPKTAGSTLNNILQKQYAPAIYHIESLDTLGFIEAFKQLHVEEQSKFKLIRGHGASLLRSEVDSAFIFTFLRHPVARMLSQYNYLRTRYDHRSAERARELNFIEFLDFSKSQGEDNLMTRFLSCKLEATLSQHKNPIVEADLNDAKAKLNSFDRVYFAEEFDASLLDLQQWLGWKKAPYYVHQNRSKGRGVDTLTVEETKAVISCEHLDMKLYEWAKNQFFGKADIKNTDLTRFQLRNRIYQRIYWPYGLAKNLMKSVIK